jgi:hypothetical protein
MNTIEVLTKLRGARSRLYRRRFCAVSPDVVPQG